MSNETIEFELEYFTYRECKSGAEAINMGRVYIDLPLDEAKKLQHDLNNRNVAIKEDK